MKWRKLVPFLRAFWHRPADYLPCGTPRSAVSLFPLPWMIPDRSVPSRVRFAAFRALDRCGPIRRRAVYEGKGGLGFRAVSGPKGTFRPYQRLDLPQRGGYPGFLVLRFLTFKGRFCVLVF